MTLKEDAINIIKEELNSIIDSKPIEGTLGVIDNRRAFAKTETYRKLRKNELSNEEIHFLLNSYRYGSQEVADFLVDAISDFTAEKLVAIGGLESMLSQSLYGLSSYSNLSNALINKFKMDNHSRSLNVILEYLRSAEGFSTDIVEAGEVMDLIIKRRFNPYENREMVFVRDQLVFSEKDKELLIAIKDNYSLIFNLTSKRQKREEEKGLIYYESALWGNNVDNFSRYIADNYSNQVSGTASFLIKTVRRCPYIEIDFVIDYINTQTEFPKEVQLIILYTLLCSNNLDPLIDFDKALKYCENLYKKSDISKDLHEILDLATERNIGNFDNFIMQVSNSNGITKERSHAIYEYYFKNRSGRIDATTETLKLKAMVVLKVPDLEIAEEVRKLNQRGVSPYFITSNFHCDPEKPYSYPGFYTMKEIMIIELTHMSSYGRERRDFADMSNEDLIQNLFFENYKSFNGRVVMTWRMANDPSFIQSLLGELNHYFHRAKNVTEVINVKNIGFKKYMGVLEDVQRKFDSNRLFYSSGLGYIKNTFEAFDQKALKFATESEIYMYKHKIPTYELLNSSYCTYKVFDYFLKRIENNNVGERVTYDTIAAVNRGVRKNKKLTRDQQIDILIRITGKPDMLRSYSIDNSKPKKITFNVVNSENLTVKDFQNYYSNIREAK